MNHFASSSFWEAYDSLPKKIRSLADKSFDLLKSNPRHPSLHFKQIGAVWSVRVVLKFRALAAEQGNDLIWFWLFFASQNSLILQKVIAGNG